MSCKSVVLRMPPPAPSVADLRQAGPSLSVYPSQREPDLRITNRDDIFESLRDYGAAYVSPTLLEQLGTKAQS